MTLDRWVTVWLLDESRLIVQEHEEPRVSAAVEMWISSGGTRDSILTMAGVGGRVVNYRASQVAGWMVSTPELRRLDFLQDARDKDEQRAFRQESRAPLR